MTRINTNVSSLIAQNTLQRSNADLNQALTRLSTGLRINTGKDDPAGLIASENLRSDITAIRRAISNTDRANQVIATADSALGQVSSLLNDIRGLVTEAANTGALSDEQISANQLQLDSSLTALNRIAQTTTFQGRRLLDGSLDFLTTAGTNFSNVSDLNINQANLGTTGSVSVNVDVATAATQATVQIASIPAGIAGVTASDGQLDFQTAAVTIAQASGTLAIGAAGAGGFDLAADASGAADGAAGNSVQVDVIDGGGGFVLAAVYNSGTNTIEVTGDITAGFTITQVAAIINTDLGTDFTTSNVTTGTTAAIVEANVGTLTGGLDAVAQVDADITIAASANGASFNRTIAITTNTTITGTGVTVADDGTTLTVNFDSAANINLSDVVTAIDGAIGTTDFTTTLTDTTGDGQFNAGVDTDPALTNVGATTAGVTAGGGLAQNIVIELGGADGLEVLTFGAGTTIADLVTGINQATDSTGVVAAINGTTATTLDLQSSAYGSSAFVDLSAITDGAGLITDTRNTGADIVASVNGVTATGNGNQISFNTATLEFNATLTAAFTGTASFTITGGGALFQLGPDVVSSQQARLGISSVNTARLGGLSGKLFQLKSGGTEELTSGNLDTAAKIVEEAINQVTELRGRLGAFQRTTLETNKNALNDTLVNLSEAESSIRDADFAAESASLTRAQILVQAGTTVLQIANSNPQNVLALLR